MSVFCHTQRLRGRRSLTTAPLSGPCVCVCVWACDPSTCATHYHVSDFSLEFQPVMPGYRSAITNRRLLASTLRQTAVTNVFQGSRGAPTPPPAPHSHPSSPYRDAVTRSRHRSADPAWTRTLRRPAIWELCFALGELFICFSTPHPPF